MAVASFQAAGTICFSRMRIARLALANDDAFSSHSSHVSLKETLDRLELCGFEGDFATCSLLLRSYRFAESLRRGRRVHDILITRGLDQSLYLSSLLVQMYTKCGGLDDAFVLFCNFHERNVFAANFIIRAFSQRGQTQVAFQIFRKMQQECIIPDKVTFICILSACANQTVELEGKRIHARILSSSFKWDVVVVTAIVSMYGSSGSLKDAAKTFQDSRERDVILWNAIMRSYIQHGHCLQTLQLFNQMQQEGIIPDKVTFLSIFQACGHHKKLAGGERMHARILHSSFERDVTVSNAVIHMYGNCGQLENAWSMLTKMDERSVVSWNAMIAVYIQNGKGKEALHLFNQMQMEGIMPDQVTFIIILGACTSHTTLFNGRAIHLCILNSGIEHDVVVRTALVNMYGKCRSIEDAENVFREVLELDLVLWTAMIAVYAKHGQGPEAFRLFDQMQQEGVLPGKVTFVSVLSACSSQAVLAKVNQFHICLRQRGFESDFTVGAALISSYGECGCPNHALEVFNKIPVRDVIAWNAMITVFSKHGQGKRVLQFYHQMQLEKFIPNKVTFINCLYACASQAMLAEGKQIHLHILNSSCEADTVVGNALLNMYGKCGSLADARNMFDNMSERNLISWNSMIAVYIQHWLVKESLELFDQMQHQGILHDKMTYANILSACASPPILAEGKRMHLRILSCGIQPDVAVGIALVNMYVKCGNLGEAWRTLDEMQERHVAAWTTLIAAYVQNGQVDEALKRLHQMGREGVMPDEITFIGILCVCANQALLSLGMQIHLCVLDGGFDLSFEVTTVLINMYGRCGLLGYASAMFDRMPKCNIVTWNAMITVYARHGLGNEVLRLFNYMQHDDVRPDSVTFVSVLTACSHAGLVDEGFHYFTVMIGVHSISPDVDHYTCIADLLARAGQLDEAEYLIRNMPCQPTTESLLTLLSGYRHQADLERLERTLKCSSYSDVDHTRLYVLLANIYATAGG